MERTVCTDRQSGGGVEGEEGAGAAGMEREDRQKAHTKMIHYGIL